MKNFLLTLLCTPLLVSCACQETVKDDQKGRKEQLDYSDFLDQQLQWKNLFFPAKSQYFIYIYSLSCGHCEHIKDDVLNFIYDDKDAFYLTEYTNEIPTSTSVSGTIGKEVIDEISILGTPTLLQVTNKYLSLNIAGEKEIMLFLNGLSHK